jgi:UDP-MurNAc hydroxylase
MAQVEYLGHAGIALEHEGRLLLCDPWLSPRGAYNASWFQYPEYPPEGLARLLRPDAVYVSHEHPDHFDPWFLAQLPRDTPILTGRFHKKRCLLQLRKLGFRTVVELNDFEAYALAPDFVVRIAVPSHNCAPHWFDSCALIHAGGRTIFNLNDANLALPLHVLRRERVDVLLAQASPAIWFPLAYTAYPPAQKKRLMAQRRESAIAAFAAAAGAIRPALAIPFAGPPCFFDEELTDLFLSPGSMFPTPPVAARQLREKRGIPSEVLKPGDRLSLAPGFPVERSPVYADFDYERDRRAYHDRRREEKRRVVREELAAIPEAAPDLFERFRDHFVPLVQKNPFFVARIDMRVLFDVTGPHGGRWVLDLRDGARGERVHRWNGEPCQYQFRLESRYVAQVLRNEYSWEDILLSFRFQARRDPDRYNQHLFTLLKMADHAALQAVARAEMTLDGGTPADTFTLAVNGSRYRVQRFCPHAGSDLSRADVVDGKLVCTGHRWHFDLETGECAETGYRIFCTRIRSGETKPADRRRATGGD